MKEKLKTRIKQLDNLILDSKTESFFETKNDENGSKLIILGSIPKATTKNNEKIRKTILDTIKFSFLDNFPTPLQTTTMEERLADLNHNLLKIGGVSADKWIEHLSCVLIEIKNDTEISIASTKGISPYLLRQDRLFNINIDNEKSKTEKEKIFPSFLTGEIQEFDKFFITANSLLNHISLPKLKEVLANNNINESYDLINDSVNNSLNKNTSNLIALLIFFEPFEIIPTSKIKLFGFSKIQKFWERFKKHFTKKSVLLIFISIIFLVFGIVFIVNRVGENKKQNEYNKMNDKLQAIETEITDAESAMLYFDTNKASKLTESAGAGLQFFTSDLSKLSVDQRTIYFKLLNRFENLSQKLKK